MNSNPDDRMYMDPEERRRMSVASGGGAGYIYQYAAPEHQEDLQDIAEQYHDHQSNSSNEKDQFDNLEIKEPVQDTDAQHIDENYGYQPQLSDQENDESLMTLGDMGKTTEISQE